MNALSQEHHKPVKPIVAFLDLHAPEVRAAIQAEAPSEIDLRMVTSTDPKEIQAIIADAEFFVGGIAPIPGALIDAAPRLRFIHKWGIGVDKIDLAAAWRRQIPVAITAGANAVPVAELTLLLMLAVLRQLRHKEDQLRAGEWKRARSEARLSLLQLRGKQVGIIGMGNIGREVAKRLHAFDAEVSYFDVRTLSRVEEPAIGVRFKPLEDLLAESDIVSLHVPLVASTRNLLSRERIARLKPGAIVVNTARGELIDQGALVEALASGRLAGAGLDVYSTEPPAADDPLLALDLPGVVLSPHVAGSVFDNVANVSRHIFENILRMLDGEPLPARDVVAEEHRTSSPEPVRSA